MKAKVIVIGMDGATFDIIKPLVKSGKLPNLARIMRNGVYGNLISTIHPVTPQAWSSFLTGKNAGKHSIFDFTSRKKHSYEIQFINASMRKAESVFSLLSKANRRVGAVGIPFTFPPERVNGFMLSGLDAPTEDGRAVYPDLIYTEIRREFGNYYIHLASPVGRRIDEDKFWKDITTENENRTSISKYLMEKYPCDLFMTVYNNTDRVQHQHLDENLYAVLQNTGDVSDEDLLVRTYEDTDAQVASLLSEIDQDTSVIVMSDHGAGPIRSLFFLNRWLEAHSLLAYRGERQGRLLKAVHQARFIAKRFFPRWTKNLIKSKMATFRDKVESLLSFSEIEWDRTKAYGFGMYGNIYINLKGREPNGIVRPGREYEELRHQIIEDLSQLRDPETGEQIVERIYKREELYQGPYLKDAPDLLIGWKDYSYYTAVALGMEKGPIFGSHMNIDSSEYKHVGTHRLNGVFMAMGKNIRQGVGILNARIIDLAPTILYILGQPIPTDMDGRVLAEIFEEEFVKNNPPKYSAPPYVFAPNESVFYTEEESVMVAERLRDLGYLE
jgi:predicted AlkP superfamily phosphohydrolase/phosphomutase